MKISNEILFRKGSPTTAGVPRDIIALLNAGKIETANLSEWLVVDQLEVAKHFCRKNHWSGLYPTIKSRLDALLIRTAPKQCEAIGRALVDAFPSVTAVDKVSPLLLFHRSDIVRSWTSHLVGLHPNLSLAEKLQRIRPLASDENMGVRETAWFAVRESIATELPAAIALLIPFSSDPDFCIRRFASEATRPRGVWCRHIQTLKENPSLGLPILEPLRSDSAKYVRDSVGNWLNDASKSSPDWVRDVCARWEMESPTTETAAIIKRALRTLRKSPAASPRKIQTPSV
jgi:3-methyladenine DNA glycosylase AlkC